MLGLAPLAGGRLEKLTRHVVAGRHSARRVELGSGACHRGAAARGNQVVTEPRLVADLPALARLAVQRLAAAESALRGALLVALDHLGGPPHGFLLGVFHGEGVGLIPLLVGQLVEPRQRVQLLFDRRKPETERV